MNKPKSIGEAWRIMQQMQDRIDELEWKERRLMEIYHRQRKSGYELIDQVERLEMGRNPKNHNSHW